LIKVKDSLVIINSRSAGFQVKTFVDANRVRTIVMGRRSIVGQGMASLRVCGASQLNSVLIIVEGASHELLDMGAGVELE
jgi:hypothetical protein